MLPPDVELHRAVELHAAVLEEPGQHAVGDGGAHLALDVVADDRHAGRAELLGPHRVGRDEHRQRVHERDARVECCLGVEAVGGLAAHRQVGHEDVGAGVTQHLRDVDRLLVRLGDRLPVEPAQPVEGVAALHRDVQRRDVGDLDRVVLAREDRLGQVPTHLLGVDVEGGDERDVPDVVAAEVDVHQPGYTARRIGVAVVVDALHERRGAVADADDRDPDLLVFPALSCHSSPGVSCGWVLSVGSASLPVRSSRSARCSDWISSLSQRTSRSVVSRPELVQLARVAVDLLARAGEHGAQTVPPLLDGAPAPFEDAHPDLGRTCGRRRRGARRSRRRRTPAAPSRRSARRSAPCPPR